MLINLSILHHHLPLNAVSLQFHLTGPPVVNLVYGETWYANVQGIFLQKLICVICNNLYICVKYQMHRKNSYPNHFSNLFIQNVIYIKPYFNMLCVMEYTSGIK